MWQKKRNTGTPSSGCNAPHRLSTPRTAKRAFRILSLRHHPDQGGSHEAFIGLKEVYDRAAAAWQRRAS